MAGWIDDYRQVKDRLAEFHQKYPNGKVVTEVVADVSSFDKMVIRASLFKGEPEPEGMPGGWGFEPDATGIASEYATTPKQGARPSITDTKWVEKCETVAIGRALANMGISKTDEPRPSAEEMEERQPFRQAQSAPPPVTGRVSTGGPPPRAPNQPANLNGPMNVGQRKAIESIMATAGIEPGYLNALLSNRFGRGYTDLSMAEAGDVIRALNAFAKPNSELGMVEAIQMHTGGGAQRIDATEANLHNTGQIDPMSPPSNWQKEAPVDPFVDPATGELMGAVDGVEPWEAQRAVAQTLGTDPPF